MDLLIFLEHPFGPSYPFEQDIMDLFAPCNFANIQGYPNDLPNNGLAKLPSFQRNNAISVMAHKKAFSSWLGKYAIGVHC